MRELKTQRPISRDTHTVGQVECLDLGFEGDIDPKLGVEPITPDSPLPVHSNHGNTAPQWASGNHDDTALPTSPINVNNIASGVETLSSPVLGELLDTWFSDYYRWMPILHKPTLLETLQHLHSPRHTSLHIVFKSITAVTVTDTLKTSLSRLTDEDRERLALSFRCQVVMEAMGSLSLRSLQALLIITILDYGAGKFSDFWNLVALCKR